MKGMIAPLLVVVGLAVPTMLGIIPAFIGVPAMLVVILVKDIIFIVLSRGLPWAMVTQRLRGGLIWGVVKRGEVDAECFQPLMGTVQTKRHGSFNIMPERILRFMGVPVGLAPENVAYNVGIDHVNLIGELKERGIDQVSDIVDTNEYGQFLGFKDDERIKDLWDCPNEWLDETGKKVKKTMKALDNQVKKGNLEIKNNQIISNSQIDMSSMDDFYKYTITASNPYHNEARIKLGIAQRVSPRKGTSPVLILAIAAVVIVGILAAMSILGGNDATAASNVAQNSSNVITAMLA